MQAGIHLPALSRSVQERLMTLPHLPGYGKPGNPVDVRGAGLDRAPTSQTLQPFFDDPDTDALLLLLAKPLSRPEDMETAQAIVSSASISPKPIFVVWMGGRDFPALQGRAGQPHPARSGDRSSNSRAIAFAPWDAISITQVSERHGWRTEIQNGSSSRSHTFLPLTCCKPTMPLASSPVSAPEEALAGS
jgi:hypothetical protein